jgi:hypothetical protein
MNKGAQTISHGLGGLAEAARALLVASVDVAGEKGGAACKRVAAALESAKEMAGNVRDKVVHE